MRRFSSELFKLIDEKLVKTNKLSEGQAAEFEKAKLTGDWKAKLKFGVPFEWFVKQLTGASFEIEKEWKSSKEIKPESVIATLRRLTKGEELQITKFNEIETEESETKLLNQ